MALGDLTAIDYTSVARTRYTDLFKNSQEFDALVTTFTDVLKEYQDQYIIFKDRVLDLDYQFGAGLDVIGSIVGQSRTLVDFNDSVHFGFAGSYRSGTFGTEADSNIGAEWYSTLSATAGSGRIMSDLEYKNVIKARIIYNKTTCSTNDFLEILNLLTFSTTNSVQWSEHGNINVNLSNDVYGLASYFLSKIDVQGVQIFPVPLGYRVTMNVTAV